MASANSSGRCWVPMWSRSPKPRVRNSATGAPLRSSRALVPRVVARRMASGGSGRPGGVAVTSRAASTGASSAACSSTATPASSPGGSGPSSCSVAPGSPGPLASTRHDAPPRAPPAPPAGPAAPAASKSSEQPAKKPAGRGSPPPPPIGIRRTAASPRRAAMRVRSAAVDSTFARRSRPRGSTARQSVNVPPVSTARRQRAPGLPPPGSPPPSGRPPRPPSSCPGDAARSVTDDLDQHPLVAAAVELAVEDLLPRSEVESPAGDRHHHLAPHDLALVVSVGIVLAGAVVAVALGAGIEGRELLEPALVVLLQSRFVVVDEDAGGDVHGVDQAEALGDAALRDRLLDLGGDVDEVHARLDVHGQVAGEALHAGAQEGGGEDGLASGAMPPGGAGAAGGAGGAAGGGGSPASAAGTPGGRSGSASGEACFAAGRPAPAGAAR